MSPLILAVIRRLRLVISFILTLTRKLRLARGTAESQDDVKVRDGDGIFIVPDTQQGQDRNKALLETFPQHQVRATSDTEDGILGYHWGSTLDGALAGSSSQKQAHSSLDPLIAARLHNIHHSAIHRLPDELLLKIILLLTKDDVSYHILWRACHLFQRIMKSPECLRSIRHICLPGDTACSSRIPRLQTLSSYLPPLCKADRILELVRRDLLCKDCLLAPRAGPSSECRFDVNRPCKNHKTYPADSPIQIHCARCPGHMHCAGCGADHPVSAFSPRMRRKHWAVRVCMGREGEVRLCEHLVIKWAAIEALVAEWRRLGGIPTISLFSRFQVKCDHPSHNFPCPAQDADPTPPSATLFLTGGAPYRMILQLHWQPHTQGLTGSKGRIQAASARRAFQEFRQDAAHFIAPATSLNSGAPPEMALFKPDTGCTCLTYEGPAGYEGLLSPPPRSISLRRQLEDIPKLPCGVSGTSHRICNHALLSSSTSLRRCYRCCHTQVYTRYKRDISLGEVPDRGPYIPSHAWFHALDMERFVGTEGDDDWRVCMDESCLDYHRVSRESHHAEVSRACDYDCPSVKRKAGRFLTVAGGWLG